MHRVEFPSKLLFAAFVLVVVGVLLMLHSSNMLFAINSLAVIFVVLAVLFIFSGIILLLMGLAAMASV
ncbi:MAG: hypothetical protein QXX51_02810 [Candidatus Bathyarchaeia archaeon]